MVTHDPLWVTWVTGLKTMPEQLHLTSTVSDTLIIMQVSSVQLIVSSAFGWGELLLAMELSDYVIVNCLSCDSYNM